MAPASWHNNDIRISKYVDWLQLNRQVALGHFYRRELDYPHHLWRGFVCHQTATQSSSFKSNIGPQPSHENFIRAWFNNNKKVVLQGRFFPPSFIGPINFLPWCMPHKSRQRPLQTHIYVFFSFSSSTKVTISSLLLYIHFAVSSKWPTCQHW